MACVFSGMDECLMKYKNRGFVLFSVLLLIAILSLLISAVNDIENTGLLFLAQKSKLFSLQQSAVKWMQSLPSTEVFFFCDHMALSTHQVILLDESWWQAHACSALFNQAQFYYLREAPYVSTRVAIQKEEGLYFAAYSRVIVRASASNGPPVYMQAWLISASTKRVEKTDGVTIRSAGIEGWESV